jgi:hypothetical protein
VSALRGHPRCAPIIPPSFFLLAIIPELLPDLFLSRFFLGKTGGKEQAGILDKPGKMIIR